MPAIRPLHVDEAQYSLPRVTRVSGTERLERRDWSVAIAVDIAGWGPGTKHRRRIGSRKLE